MYTGGPKLRYMYQERGDTTLQQNGCWPILNSSQFKPYFMIANVQIKYRYNNQK